MPEGAITGMTASPMGQTMSFKAECEMDRASIKAVADILFSLKKSISNMSASGVTENSDHDEMIENVTLAYRHLEDASMRLGKAIQAFDGGKSVYDKSTVVGA